MAMRNQQDGKEATQSKTLQTVSFPWIVQGPSEQRLLLAYFKERLEALIQDERYEEAGELNHEIQTLKDTLKEKQNLKHESHDRIGKFFHFILFDLQGYKGRLAGHARWSRREK